MQLILASCAARDDEPRCLARRFHPSLSTVSILVYILYLTIPPLGVETVSAKVNE